MKTLAKKILILVFVLSYFFTFSQAPLFRSFISATSTSFLTNKRSAFKYPEEIGFYVKIDSISGELLEKIKVYAVLEADSSFVLQLYPLAPESSIFACWTEDFALQPGFYKVRFIVKFDEKIFCEEKSFTIFERSWFLKKKFGQQGKVVLEDDIFDEYGNEKNFEDFQDFVLEEFREN